MPFRRHDTRRRAQANGVHLSTSLSSFSSPITSSAPPATPPSDRSLSDHHIATTLDQFGHSTPFIASNTRRPPDRILPVPRSSSLFQSMGQVPSRSQQPQQPQQQLQLITATVPPPSPTGPVTTGSAGSRLKRVFGSRRKKSEDVSPIFTPTLPPPPMAMGKSRSVTSPASSASSSLSSAPKFPHHPSVSAGPGYPSSSFNRHVSAVEQHPPPSSAPCPKPLPESPPSNPNANPSSPSSSSDPRSSAPIAPSGSNLAALQHVCENENVDDVAIVMRRPKKRESDHEVMKEDWRKSDSTMTSYYTVRPRSGTSGGTRTPRPVSMAESLQSTSTVVPAGKRLSALLTEAEFIMTEQDVTRSGATPLSRKTSPSEPSKTRKRHSISLSFSSPLSSNQPTGSASADGHSSRPAFRHRPSGEVATLSKAAASGIISSSHGGSFPSTGSHIRGNLAALSAATTVPPSLPRSLPQPPSIPAVQYGSQRQPAVTMAGGPVPTAGAAMGFGKRAVEFMGRAFGGLGSSNSTGHSSSSSSISTMDDVGRNASSVSLASHASQTHTGKGKQRRTPNAPSGAWSIHSSNSTSTGPTDPESFVINGPTLGVCLRGPMLNGSGVPVTAGLVFGRDLKTCVRDTAIDAIRDAVRLTPPTSDGPQTGKTCSPFLLCHLIHLCGEVSLSLHERRLPALVVRCAEHLMKWGMEEEGLFR
jgi:hypothetical protein